MTDIDTSTWKEFKLTDLGFKVYHGKRLKQEDRIAGILPFITAGEQNRGVAGKLGNDGLDVYENVITIDMFGNCFYHPYKCSGDDNIYFFVNDSLDDKIKFFIATMINNSLSGLYSYGKQFRQKNADNVTALLPAKEEYVPDFDYMESYIKEIEKESITRMKKERERKIEAGRKAIGTEKIYAGDDEISEDVEWGEFEIGSLFDIQTSKSFNKNDVDFTVKGNCDFIGRTSAKTGIQGKCNKLYTEPNSKDTFSLVQIGERVCFYRERDWYASQNIFVLTPKFKTDRKNATFISSAVTRALKEVYGDNAYNRYPTLKTLPKLAIQLPVDRATGKPDWKYMENYISILQKNSLIRYSKDSRKNILTAEKIIASNEPPVQSITKS